MKWIIEEKGRGLGYIEQLMIGLEKSEIWHHREVYNSSRTSNYNIPPKCSVKLKNWPYLVANLCQNYDRRERHHGYYGLEVLCSVFPGRWAEPAGQQRFRWTLSVQSMLVLEQPSPLDLQKNTNLKHCTKLSSSNNWTIWLVCASSIR